MSYVIPPETAFPQSMPDPKFHTSGASETASARSKNCDLSLLQGDRSRWESDRSQIRPAGLLLRVRAHAYLLLYVSGRPEQLARQTAAYCGVKKNKKALRMFLNITEHLHSAFSVSIFVILLVLI